MVVTWCQARQTSIVSLMTKGLVTASFALRVEVTSLGPFCVLVTCVQSDRVVKYEYFYPSGITYDRSGDDTRHTATPPMLRAGLWGVRVVVDVAIIYGVEIVGHGALLSP